MACFHWVSGLPSAMAAKLVKPDKAVMAIVGDGGFLMNSQVTSICIQRCNLGLFC